MWIKTIYNEYITEYTNMDTGFRFTLELFGDLHMSFRSRFDEKIDIRTLWEGKHTKENYSIYKSLIKNVDELLKEEVRLMDFQQIIAHIQSNEDDGKRKFIDKLEEEVKKI